MSWAIWITGRPGCSTSTEARAAAAHLAEAVTPVAVVEPDPRHSAVPRDPSSDSPAPSPGAGPPQVSAGPD